MDRRRQQNSRVRERRLRAQYRRNIKIAIVVALVVGLAAGYFVGASLTARKAGAPVAAPAPTPDAQTPAPTAEITAEPTAEITTEPTAEPTAAPTATPPQVAGTAVTIGDGVPFRQTYDATSAIIAVLPKDTEVEVLGQAYTMNGEAWHSVRYSGNLGYIRADMLRFVTNTDAPATTQPTVNPDGLSAYGYVSSSTVNFRQAASTSSTRLRVLKKYAMCLVLGTEQVGDTTWYHVKYDNQEGYIAGNYFKHMTNSEVNAFLGSDEYRQGVLNNSTANNNQDNTGSFVGGTGGVQIPENEIADSLNTLFHKEG